METIKPCTEEARKNMAKIDKEKGYAGHRRYNKWYKELWYWFQEKIRKE